MVSRWKVGLLTLGGVTLSLWLATPAPAEMLPVKMTGQHGAHYKGRSRLAVISYSINHVTAQQATAVGGWGTRARGASAGGSVVLKLRVESPVNIQNPGPRGMGIPGMMRPDNAAIVKVRKA